MISRRTATVSLATIVVFAGGAFYLVPGKPKLPTAEAKVAEFVQYEQLRGEVQATKSSVLSAPFSAGDLQILTLAKTGSAVKKGDVVVQFDQTNVKRTFDQKQSELKSADAEIARSIAQSHMDFEQKTTDALAASYNVERAKLDVSKQEILSEIEAQKTRLTLADTEQKLEEAKTKVASSEAGAKANLESAKQKRNKALFDLKIAQRQMAALTLRTPVDGIISISPNLRARGFFGDGTSPEFKQGDRAWPGAAVAEIPELDSMRILAKVDEIDRGNLHVEQEAVVRIEAVPDREFHAVIASISAVGKPDFSLWPPPKNFDVVLAIKDKDARLRPGMSASVRVVVKRTPKALTVPVESVFEKDGRSVVYVVRGSHIDERQITVSSRGETSVVIESGLRAGELVSLKNPITEGQTKP